MSIILCMSSSDFGHWFKITRESLGLTQIQLAHESGVSLPTIQNIKAGKGNPSLTTLTDILSPFGMKVTIDVLPTDWELLGLCGAPLNIRAKPKIKPNPRMLVRNLSSACFELRAETLPKPGLERKREAVQALLFAIHAHYRDFFRRNLGGPLFQSLLPKKATGRLIKLERQSLAVISEYL